MEITRSIARMNVSDNVRANPQVDIDEASTESLIERFNRHVDMVQSHTLSTSRMVYEVCCARGLHKLLAERACEGDDDAGNVALGAPHWLTFNDGTLETMLR